jgi:8-oxo-dGTP pyrophosphatase MutT (NUDIX family)
VSIVAPIAATFSMTFIVQLARRLASRTPVTFEAPKRASVAIILRVTGFEPEAYRADTSALPSATDARAAFLSSRAAAESSPSNSEILYMKRTTNPSDPWSGNVAFPGGRREPADASDWHTAVRETREEIGLDLQGGPFMFLGRLDDRAVYARGRRRSGFALCPFVFVQTVAATPPITLSEAEVAAVRWIAFEHLVEDNGELSWAATQSACLLLVIYFILCCWYGVACS